MYLAGIDILSILLCIISLGILVIIHELGHFTMAKLFNVYVNEFSIGFGPQLLKKKKGYYQNLTAVCGWRKTSPKN